jgi:hypothetical protein
MQGSHMTQIN